MIEKLNPQDNTFQKTNKQKSNKNKQINKQRNKQIIKQTNTNESTDITFRNFVDKRQ